ncbi:HepT-like ribonuclease domain-containing protein [Methanoregula sp.]|uniref:HepT-like ribonuclease domain-containing protein n=1 Tax=Methanoregula sp. TaxID=2052170 RepID=UPI00343815F4
MLESINELVSWWRRQRSDPLAGERDIVTHRYFRVDWNLLWISIHEELPVLKNQIHILMNREKG